MNPVYDTKNLAYLSIVRWRAELILGHSRLVCLLTSFVFCFSDQNSCESYAVSPNILRTVKEASAVDFAKACKKLVFSSYC